MNEPLLGRAAEADVADTGACNGHGGLLNVGGAVYYMLNKERVRFIVNESKS